MQPKVYIIILNWNGFEDTAQCLKSVMELEYDNYKIILVDNGSVDGSVEKFNLKFPEIKLIKNENNVGFASASNQGIKYAMEEGADYIWLLNNDTVVPRDVLSNLVAACASPQIGLASPLIYYYDSPEIIQFCGSVIDWENKKIKRLENLEELAAIDVKDNLSLWGTALLIQRKVIDDVGYLSEKYFAYHEDEEYCLRVARAGYRSVVVPDARIFHKNSRSTGSNDAPMQVFLRSRNLYFLWMDALKGMERNFRIRKYLAYVISYGGSLREKNLPDSVEACLDGVWHAFRGAGGPRNPEITMPIPLRKMFHFLFSWHPYFWVDLLRGDLPAIASNIKERIGQRG